MLPLSVDDLVPLEEYASRRKDFFDAHRRYVDRYRRIRIGPKLTLIFENRQTLWFRIQEVLRVARLSDPAIVQRELDVYLHARLAEEATGWTRRYFRRSLAHGRHQDANRRSTRRFS